MDGEFEANTAFQDDAYVIETARDEFIRFLKEFKPLGPDGEEPAADARPYYIDKLDQMAERQELTLEINAAHVRQQSGILAEVLFKNFVRIEPALRKAVQNVVREHIPDYCKYENDDKEKEFYVSVYNVPLVEPLRDLKTSKLGCLTAFYGTVTRTTEVRPELFMGTFQCKECNTTIHDVEQQFKFTQPLICTNPTCGNRKEWILLREESTFLDWQRVRVQENTDEVPAGNLPRTMDVVLRGNMVERAKAGDKVLFTGSLIVVPEVAALSAPGQRAALQQVSKTASQSEGVTGLKSLGVRELFYRLMFLASHVQSSDSKTGMVNIRPDEELSQDEVVEEFSEEDKRQLRDMMADANIYENLVASLCPSVLGHHTIKQAVLLMLFGGVHKKTQEGINLRGDINVCIIGDPAVAKSQVLKYVASFLPRAIYTSGKSSTAAGLTASVVKDSDSNEFCIEAGALMLADNGICCIDEFDKMDVKDQVAIHEAMEQQTISLAKAGISATLNARASILAAANPIGGRYDKRKTLKQNIFLPPAILSRFDLLHVMMDEPSHDADTAIAHHIIRVHTLKEQAFVEVPYTTEAIQKYIRFARTIKPKITPASKEALVKAYKELRCEDAAPGSNTSYRMTVRQLEAMVRLSEALARVWLDDEVKPKYVLEAKLLLKSSVLRIDLDQNLELDDLDQDRPSVPRRTVNLGPTPQPAASEPDSADDMQTDGADENAGDIANQQIPPQPEAPAAKRRKVAPQQQKSPQPAPRSTQEAQPAQAAEPARATAAPAKRKVNAREFARIKGILLRLLRDKARAAQLSQMDAPESEDPVADMGSSGGDRVDVSRDMGMQQSQLVQQYIEHPAVSPDIQKLSPDARGEHCILVHRIIAHLIKREGVIVVVSTPLQKEGEPNGEYSVRLEYERIVALHPNFDPENL